MPLNFFEHIDLDIVKVASACLGAFFLSLINMQFLDGAESILKICVLLVSLGYAIWKWYRDSQRYKKKLDK